MTQWSDEEPERREAGEDGTSDGGERVRAHADSGSERPAYLPEDDEAAMRALEFVTNVLDEMHMECSVRLEPPGADSPTEIRLDVSGEDAGRVIGKKGQVLGALQFLTNRVVNRPGQERRHVLVDVEGYRQRREDQLATMAVRLANQAIELGKIITFEPMNPRDRRVVHLALAKLEGVVTQSDGEGEERRVQIIPVRR